MVPEFKWNIQVWDDVGRTQRGMMFQDTTRQHFFSSSISTPKTHQLATQAARKRIWDKLDQLRRGEHLHDDN